MLSPGVKIRQSGGNYIISASPKTYRSYAKPDSNTYNNKLNVLEQKRHQFNEENLFDMNYKAMARSEDYKYIVISGAQNNFNIICNISLCICPLFGFSKEELIGKPLDFLLPELFCIHHKKLLLEKVEDFKKTILAKHKNMSLKVRYEPRIIQTFAKPNS